MAARLVILVASWSLSSSLVAPRASCGRAPRVRETLRVLRDDDLDQRLEEPFLGGDVVLGEGGAVAALGLVTALWGSQHAVTKWALGADGGAHVASSLTAARFLVAAAALAPFAPRDVQTWRAGAELGLLGFLGFAFQTVGLETTTATRSAFLLYLNVKLVPVLELARGAELPRGTWPTAAVAVLGTALLAADADVGGSGGVNWVVGDSWSVAAALASAAFVVRLEGAAREATSPAGLTAASAATTALVASLWCGLENNGGDTNALFFATAGGGEDALSSNFAAAAVYLGLVPSALCGVLQTVAQRTVAPSQAAVIYATDPLWAAGFAFFGLGETLGPAGLAGAGLIAAAAFGQRAAAGLLSARPQQGS